MLKKVAIFKALDVEIKKQRGPVAVKDAYKGHHSLKEELSQPGITILGEVAGGDPGRGQDRVAGSHHHAGAPAKRHIRERRRHPGGTQLPIRAIGRGDYDAVIAAGDEPPDADEIGCALADANHLDLKVAAIYGGADLSRFDIDGFRPQSAADRTLGNVRLGWRGESDTVTLLVSGHDQNAQDPLGLTRQQYNADPLQTAPQATQFNTRKSIEQTQGGVNWQHRFGNEQGLVQTNFIAYLGTRSVTPPEPVSTST